MPSGAGTAADLGPPMTWTDRRGEVHTIDHEHGHVESVIPVREPEEFEAPTPEARRLSPNERPARTEL